MVFEGAPALTDGGLPATGQASGHEADGGPADHGLEGNRVMPMPSAMTRFNRVVNPVTRLFIAWVPGYAVVHHLGRVSGRVYRTPVKVYRRPDGYNIAIPYGPETEWVKNILTAGGCELKIRGRFVRVARPMIVHNETYGEIPAPARRVLRLAGVSTFLRLTRV